MLSATLPSNVRVGPNVTADQLEQLAPLIRDSPFLDTRYPFTAYEFFKVLLFLPWTIFRFMLFLLIGPWVILHVWLLIRTYDRDEPLPPFVSAKIQSIIRFWGGVLLRLVCHFWSVKVTGAEHLASCPRSVLLYNHIGWIDPLVLVVLFTPSGVAKAGVANLPLFGTMARALRFVFVERKGMDEGSQRRSATSTASQGGGAALVAKRVADPRYPLVMIAPEGTTKAVDCVLRFSTGAFVSGAPVTLLLLKYHAKHCHPGWGRYPIAWHMLRLFSQFANYLEVQVLPVYVPSEEERASPALYAANVRALMARTLGYPEVDQGLSELVMLKRNGVTVNWLGENIEVAGER